ncbi:patatin-like phospholipase family protein [Ramlibacter alkalitolerans]|uniref:Patatin-like phospholipase family protein n=1 Tax=Ramlibacter alkalitolerans TaxID=2039631 RepID=A0ABS1JJE3_9BURK|nr:patatin-like phospholipase family protein [Ramlibacter alkalitolerans]MBL0424337.1 patatin-like phospholipase family protein [Ramlibacter alkalitolerans]
MAYAIRTRDEHLQADGAPKRILALDGGGLRGIVSIAFLERMESILRARHGGSPDFRLCHYFDLIAGTSTGAIIAAALAKGMAVAEIRERYNVLGREVFERSLLRQGLFRAKYDAQRLSVELKKVYGEHTLLGGPELQTGLMVMTKRIDTGSPWPMSNNPRGRYFSGDGKRRVGNCDFPLWQVVRASTAAPVYFDPEPITILHERGAAPLAGSFVDGGVSPYNNPALQALMYATLDGYRIGWPTGPEKLLLVSVGTGAKDPAVAHASLAAQGGVQALVSLMDDCAAMQQTLLQWLSSSPTARTVDRELGDLRHDLLGGAPLISYLRYDLDLRPAPVRELDDSLTNDKAIAALSEMDAPENMPVLYALAGKAADRCDLEADFPHGFDLAGR